ncbi:MAG: hypothetical protein M0R75_04475 [Dehalococcoidia bacterium]|jgi:hypothetical protein|nr:hypothetical protein [Dehalococcoidia bacterium]
MRFLRRFVILALVVGVVVKVLQKFGILGGGECTPGCACSQGATECYCGHATCLAPSAA